MKTLHSILITTTVLLLFSCGQKESSSVQREDKSKPKANIPTLRDNIISEKTIDKAYVNMDLADLKKAYSGYQFQDTPIYYFGLDGEERELVIAKNNKPLMFVWTSSEKKVNSLFAISNEFHTDNGLRPGMTIKQIKEIYPECEMAQDNMSGNMEYIFIPDKKVTLCFMSNQKTIGIYHDSEAVTLTTKIFKSDTFRVQFIETSR